MSGPTSQTTVPGSRGGATLLTMASLLLVSCAQAPQNQHIPPGRGAQLVQFGEITCSVQSYPAEAARANATTRAQFEVDPRGKVTNAVVITSAGPSPQHQLLDAATLRMLATCAYPPRPDETVVLVKKLDYVWRLAQ
jgi:TonB family protein